MMNCLVCGSPTGYSAEDVCSQECYILYVGEEDDEENDK